jgi:hypothetical protein
MWRVDSIQVGTYQHYSKNELISFKDLFKFNTKLIFINEFNESLELVIPYTRVLADISAKIKREEVLNRIKMFISTEEIEGIFNRYIIAIKPEFNLLYDNLTYIGTESLDAVPDEILNAFKIRHTIKLYDKKYPYLIRVGQSPSTGCDTLVNLGKFILTYTDYFKIENDRLYLQDETHHIIYDIKDTKKFNRLLTKCRIMQ